MRYSKEHTETISAIDKMIEERERYDVPDDQKSIFDTICKNASKSTDIKWMKTHLYNSVKDFDRTLIIHHHNVMSAHNQSRGYREGLLLNAVKQNSLRVIKRFLDGQHIRYAISIWFARNTLYDYDVDNVAKLFMDALHRPPDHFWQYEGYNKLFPIMLDDGRVDELHVYKNVYLGEHIPSGIFAKLEVR